MAAKPVEPWHKLDDKVVLVTGASSGLGCEFCLDLAKAGCRIVAAARRLDRLHSLCHEINNLYGNGTVRAVSVELDVSADSATIDRSIQKAWDAFGYIDALINNAGVRGIYIIYNSSNFFFLFNFLINIQIHILRFLWTSMKF